MTLLGAHTIEGFADELGQWSRTSATHAPDQDLAR